MLDSYTVGDLVAEVLLTKNTPKAFVVIVEGATDCRLFRRFFIPSECEILIGRGKANVVGAIEQLDGLGTPGIVGIVDADFWAVENSHPGSGNLFVTDFHDAEIMILCSCAFDRFLEENASLVGKLQAIHQLDSMPTPLSLTLISTYSPGSTFNANGCLPLSK